MQKILTAKKDLPSRHLLPDVHEAERGESYRRLPAACLADQGQRFSREYVQREVSQRPDRSSRTRIGHAQVPNFQERGSQGDPYNAARRPKNLPRISRITRIFSSVAMQPPLNTDKRHG